MTDITTTWDVQNQRGDWTLVNAVLQTGNDLPTAILNSLFSDRIAHTDDAIPDGTNDPRGWCCDETEDEGGVLLGSRLWMLVRSAQRSVPPFNVLQMANDYVEEALQWLIDDQVVASFELDVEFTMPGMIGITVTAVQSDGTLTPAYQYQYVWKGL